MPATTPRSRPRSTSRATGTCKITYAAGSSTHSLHLRQRGSEIDGAHRGDFVTRDLAGIDRRRRGAHPQRLRRGARRFDRLHLHRHGEGRRDVGRARHGRVPRRDVDGEATRTGGEARLMRMTVQRGIDALVVLGHRRGRRRRPFSHSNSRPRPADRDSAGGEPPKKYDLLLRGGHVIDPRTISSGVRDVGIAAARSRRSRAKLDPNDARQDRRRLRASTSRPASSTSTRTSTPAPASRARTPATTASIPTASASASG